MFLRYLKKIFYNIQINNIPEAELYATNLRNIFHNLQNGGDNEFHDALKKDLDPAIETLKLEHKYIPLMILAIKFIIDYIEKLNVDDLAKVNKSLEDMLVILEKRLEQEKS